MKNPGKLRDIIKELSVSQVIWQSSLVLASMFFSLCVYPCLRLYDFCSRKYRIMKAKRYFDNVSFVLILLACFAFPSIARADLTTNLVSYWQLDEASGNAADSVASITLTPGGSLGYVSAFINNGANGGASNSTKYLANTSSAPLSGSQIATAFTMSGWVNMYDVSTDKIFMFMNNSDGGNRRQVYIRFLNSGDHAGVGTFPGGGGSSGGGTGSATLSASTWYLLTVTYDGSNLKLYVNDTLDGTFSFAYSTGFANTPSTSLLGQYEGGIYETASAIIDEVGVWSRALSGAEVTELYNSGDGLQGPTFDPPAPLEGCTDPEANNYDSDAEEDDGSCTYDEVVVDPAIFASPFTSMYAVASSTCVQTSSGTTTPMAYRCNATSSPVYIQDSGNISIGLAIIIVMLSLMVVGFMYNNITRKKPWH